MPATKRQYTIQDVRAMPDDGNRYEVIDGELFVTPAPATRHQAAIRELSLTLWTYAKPLGLGALYFAPTDVVLGPTTLVEPDILFVRETRRGVITERDVTAAPDLAIEILSPGTARIDRGRKRVLYQTTGVAEYWIVDLEQRLVEVWRPEALEATVHRDRLTWRPDPTVTPLVIELSEIFDAR